MPQDIITLQCKDCKERNYSTTKNKKKHSGRLEHKKYCPRCRKHTAPREAQWRGAQRQREKASS